MKKKFVPIIGDLSKLNEQEQQDYVLAACEFLQVPPELHLVNLQWMDTGDGARQLLLYVRRGATDIIRDRRKISVESLVANNGEGYVGFIATGKDSTGRQEIAVGAVSTKGLNGQAVANGVKTAQTQALRRMTLQFAGGGFLDESEVNEKTTNIVNVTSSLKPQVQPEVTPNTAAGKDITQDPLPEKSSETASVSAATVPDALAEGRRKRGRPRKVVSIDAPAQSESQKLQAELEPIVAHDPMQTAMGSAALITTNAKVELSNTSIPCSDEQKKEFRQKLQTYVNDILPKAGFLQTENQTRNEKMKLFVQTIFPDTSTRNLSATQWHYFFRYLEETIKLVGAEGLVKTIEQKIGGSNETVAQLANSA